MGHWSVKCAISSLPICGSDPVVMLLGANFDSRKGADTGGFIYQPHFFNLLAPPIFGNYNTYGWVEDCDKESVSFAYEALKLVWGRLGQKGEERPNPFSRGLIVGTEVVYARASEQVSVPLGSEGVLVAPEGKQEYNVQRVEFMLDGVSTVVIVPTEALDILPRVPEMPDIRDNDIHWHDFNSDMCAYTHESYDYTFIHRAVWDKLVAASRENFHGDFHLGYDRDDDSDKVKADRQQVKDVLIKHGGRIGKYSPYSTPDKLFNASIELWNTDLVDKQTVEDKLLGAGAPPDAVEQLKGMSDKERRAFMLSMPEDKRELVREVLTQLLLAELDMGDQRGYGSSFARCFAGWFEPAFSRKYNPTLNISYVNDLLKLIKQDELPLTTWVARRQILLETQLVFNALVKGGIVVRGATMLASEQQDGGPYWPHLSVHDAIFEVMHKEAVDQHEYEGDGEFTLSPRSAVEELANKGLDESYEWRDD